MGEAILAGFLAKSLVDPSAVIATVRSPERAVELAERYGVVAMATSEEAEANTLAVTGADVVLLGVKPAQIVPLCEQISPALSAGAVVISVAAAVSLAQLEAALPEDQPVVRSMPNTPLMVGRGVVALSPGASVSAEQAELAQAVFAGSGLVLEVPETQMSAIGAISGSGPAYIFYVAEAMAAAAQELGLEAQTAQQLAAETAAGAGLMLAQDGADPAALRKAVTSPNGTTERAIATFTQQGLPAVILAGARAAAERSEEMTQELSD